MTSLAGVDVSKWQGPIDWGQAAPAVEFVMVKASEGVVEVDVQHAANVSALRAAGKPLGHYHYPDAGDPVVEADYFVAAAGRRPGELQALDFEGAVLLGLPDPAGWAARFLSRVIDRTSNRPLIYMSASTLGRCDWAPVLALNVGLWVAAWQPTEPAVSPWPFAAMWQTSSSGHVPGIAGNVDTDVFLGDQAQLAAYAADNISLPAPAPAPRPAPAPAPAPAQPTPPASPSPTPAPAADPRYEVRAGDTLSGIGARFGVTVGQLVDANRTAYPTLGWNPDLIRIGWQLTIPSRTAAPEEVTVEAGDTLSGIAAQHGDTLAAVEQANPQIHDPNVIYPGEQVNLP